MPEQEQGKQFGGVPDNAGRKASAVSAHDTRLAGPRPRAAASTPEQTAFQTLPPIGVQIESDGSGPALAPLIPRPRSDAARVFSGEARTAESDGRLRRVSIDPPRG